MLVNFSSFVQPLPDKVKNNTQLFSPNSVVFQSQSIISLVHIMCITHMMCIDKVKCEIETCYKIEDLMLLYIARFEYGSQKISNQVLTEFQ